MHVFHSIQCKITSVTRDNKTSYRIIEKSMISMNEKSLSLRIELEKFHYIMIKSSKSLIDTPFYNTLKNNEY